MAPELVDRAPKHRYVRTELLDLEPAVRVGIVRKGVLEPNRLRLVIAETEQCEVPLVVDTAQRLLQQIDVLSQDGIPDDARPIVDALSAHSALAVNTRAIAGVPNSAAT